MKKKNIFQKYMKMARGKQKKLQKTLLHSIFKALHFFDISHKFGIHQRLFKCIFPAIFLGTCFITGITIAPVEAEKNDRVSFSAPINQSFLAKKKQFLEGRKKTILSLSQNPFLVQVEHNTRINTILTNDPEYLREYGSRSYRNNNPGNLKYTGQIGAIGKDDKNFAIFESYEAGRLAHMRQIALDAQRGKTLKSFIKVFAPHDENHTSAYENEILESFGQHSANTPLSDFELEKLQSIMQQIEGWRQPIVQKENTLVALENQMPQEQKLEERKKSPCSVIQDTKERIQCFRAR